MNPFLTRRSLLKTGGAVAATLALPLPTLAQERRFEPQVGPWRSFELTTVVTVPEVRGTTRLWLPVPSIDSDYHKSGDNSWAGNATAARIASDPLRGVRMLHAEFAASAGSPTLTLTSRLQTRNRSTDWSRSVAAAEDPAVLRASVAPT